MKKLINIYILMFLVLLSFNGCGGRKQANKVSGVIKKEKSSQGKMWGERVWSAVNNPYVSAIVAVGITSAVWYFGFYKPAMKKIADLISVSPAEEEEQSDKGVQNDERVQNLEKQLEALNSSKNEAKWLATKEIKELENQLEEFRAASHGLAGKPETAEKLRAAIIEVTKYSMDLRKENEELDKAKLRALRAVSELQQEIAEHINQIEELNQQKASLSKMVSSFFRLLPTFFPIPIYANIFHNEPPAQQLAIAWDGINKDESEIENV
jgi:ribosomal protein S16